MNEVKSDELVLSAAPITPSRPFVSSSAMRDTMMNTFDSKLKDALKLSPVGSIEEPPVLYHYTTANGLKSMVEKGSLWTTPSPFLNDIREFHLGLGVFTRAATKLATTHSDVGTRVKQCLKWLRRFSTPSAMWLTSFTLQPDELSQWRAYAADGYGYAVGFETRELMHLLPQPTVCSVIYKPIEQRAFAIMALTAAVDTAVAMSMEFPGRLEAYDRDNVKLDEIEGWLMQLGPVLRALCTTMKHYGFSVEKEYRLIVNAGLTSNLEIEVEPRKGAFVPHIPLRWREPDACGKSFLPIREVITGPNLRPPDDAIGGMQMFLHRHNYVGKRKIEVKSSKIPYLA